MSWLYEEMYHTVRWVEGDGDLACLASIIKEQEADVDSPTDSTALQHPCSSQTDYHFTTTTDESKGQRQTELQTGSSLQDQMLRLPGHLYR